MKAQTTIMTYAEMEAAFDGEWVLIGEPELTPMNEVVRGIVLFHSKSRDEVYLDAEERNLKRVAILYIGSPSCGYGFSLVVRLIPSTPSSDSSSFPSRFKDRKERLPSNLHLIPGPPQQSLIDVLCKYGWQSSG